MTLGGAGGDHPPTDEAAMPTSLALFDPVVAWEVVRSAIRGRTRT